MQHTHSHFSLTAQCADGVANSYTAEQPQSPYAPEINNIERQLLTLFRKMPTTKQLALLSLFN
jgi:hypothetical protein